MPDTPYLKQYDDALFPNILWNRPISNARGGRLLLIGGHRGEFSQIQHIYQAADASGAGECKVALPDILKPLLSSADIGFFVPSSPSGSLGKGALRELLQLSTDFDVACIGANLSRNSETTVLMESLIAKMIRPFAIFGDALEAVKFNPRLITDNPNCLILLTMTELFKLANNLGVGIHVTGEQGLLGRIAVVQQFTKSIRATIVLLEQEIIIDDSEQTSVTVQPISATAYPIAIATLATFWMQNQAKPFEGLTTGAYILRSAHQHLQADGRPATFASLTATISRSLDQF